MNEEVKAPTPTLDLVVEEMNLGKLTTNAEGLRDMVKGKLAGYSVENYSGDRIKEAKADKSELNAFAKRLNDKRLEFERMWMKPFEPFKAVVDEIVKLIKTTSSKIDEVVKDVEQGERDEKRRLIDQYWAGQSCTFFRLDQIFDERWLNKTAKLSTVQDEILERIKKVESDLGILDKIGVPEAKAFYLNCLDLNRAMAEADRIKANRERLAKVEEGRRAQEEADHLPILSPAIKTTEPEAPEQEEYPLFAEEEAEPEQPVASDPQPPSSPPVIEARLVVRGTKKALNDLFVYLSARGIEYSRT
jgi:hypothetical protein